ncbi:VOC family protein [Stackebrandtia soli]|uniref:VOC family protein n=1 Tax=Stackebrandtia soli TaxID=1892856 RepID=UPI0039E9CA8F
MIKLSDVVIDCSDTMGMARFYAAVAGGTVREDSDLDWASVDLPGFALAFQHVNDYRAPEWPGQERGQQVHIDFEVDDLEAEGARIVELGAMFREEHIGDTGYGFVVYLDPAGHPFCLCRTRS